MEEVKKKLGMISHGVGGFASALSIVVSPVLMVSLCLLFLVYEFTDYWEEEDWPTRECKEFLIGFSCGAITLIVVKVISLI